MNNIQMLHEKDPKQVLIDQVGKVVNNLHVLNTQVLVAVYIRPEKTKGGIIIPDTAKEKPQRGRVLAVGPGPRDEDGEHIKMEIEVGDEVGGAAGVLFIGARLCGDGLHRRRRLLDRGRLLRGALRQRLGGRSDLSRTETTR